MIIGQILNAQINIQADWGQFSWFWVLLRPHPESMLHLIRHLKLTVHWFFISPSFVFCLNRLNIADTVFSNDLSLKNVTFHPYLVCNQFFQKINVTGRIFMLQNIRLPIFSPFWTFDVKISQKRKKLKS